MLLIAIYSNRFIRSKSLLHAAIKWLYNANISASDDTTYDEVFVTAKQTIKFGTLYNYRAPAFNLKHKWNTSSVVLAWTLSEWNILRIQKIYPVKRSV